MLFNLIMKNQKIVIYEDNQNLIKCIKLITIKYRVESTVGIKKISQKKNLKMYLKKKKIIFLKKLSKK